MTNPTEERAYTAEEARDEGERLTSFPGPDESLIRRLGRTLRKYAEDQDTIASLRQMLAKLEAYRESAQRALRQRMEALDRATARIAALESAPDLRKVAEEWRPIETAPKDGTPILIWQPDVEKTKWSQRVDDARYAIGYWRVDDEDQPYGASWGNRNSSQVNPSHWMPLPEPPSSPRSEEEEFPLGIICCEPFERTRQDHASDCPALARSEEER